MIFKPMTFFIVAACVLIAIIAFLLGMFWKDYKTANQRGWILTEDLIIQESPGSIGVLPEGTMLYKYRDMGETSTYVVFLNTKNLNLLKEDINSGISPLSAYPKD